MINILFITRFPITSKNGGIEQITNILIRNFPNDIKCYSAYIIPTQYDRTEVSAEINVSPKTAYEDLLQFVKKHKIDVIINQQNPELTESIAKIRKKTGIKTFYFQHDKTIVPLKPLLNYLYLSIFADVTTLLKIKNILKLLFFPIYISFKKANDRKTFRQIYEDNDKLIILTKYYLPVILKTLAYNEDKFNKIGIINNSITSSIPENINFIQSRPKRVLIVSRMTEDRKRIILALKIWRNLQHRYPTIATQWNLDIVGTGEFLNFYKRYVSSRKIPNVMFYGHVNDITQFYQTSQIFMMTSYSEGWGLTIMEAQQHGVVPIAFDSFEAVKEIIDGTNGNLVEEGDIDGYVDQLAILMSSSDYRMGLSLNALSVSEKYSTDKMIAQWLKYLRNVSSFN